MNLISTAGTIAAIFATIGGGVYAGMNELNAVRKEAEEKYVPLSDWKSFKWSQIKKDLRDIKGEIAEAEQKGLYEYAERLEEEYEELLEYLCLEYPEDREC